LKISDIKKAAKPFSIMALNNFYDMVTESVDTIEDEVVDLLVCPKDDGEIELADVFWSEFYLNVAKALLPSGYKIVKK
jgi:hypothetical protein